LLLLLWPLAVKKKKHLHRPHQHLLLHQLLPKHLLRQPLPMPSLLTLLLHQPLLLLTRSNS